MYVHAVAAFLSAGLRSLTDVPDPFMGCPSHLTTLFLSAGFHALLGVMYLQYRRGFLAHRLLLVPLCGASNSHSAMVSRMGRHVFSVLFRGDPCSVKRHVSLREMTCSIDRSFPISGPSARFGL